MSGQLVSQSSPRRLASSTHSSEYPLPSKRMGLHVLMSSRRMSIMASVVSCPFFDKCVDAVLEVDECLGNGRVEGYHRAGAVGLGAYGAELEAVTREGERACAVAVGVVDEQLGYLGYVELHALLACHVAQRVVVALLYVVEQVAQLCAEERRYDCRRCLVGAETVGVGGAHYRGLDESVVAVEAHECLYDEGYEAQVVLRRLAGSVEKHARVRGEAPVVVLARAVDACEGLFRAAARGSRACGPLSS